MIDFKTAKKNQPAKSIAGRFKHKLDNYYLNAGAYKIPPLVQS